MTQQAARLLAIAIVVASINFFVPSPAISQENPRHLIDSGESVPDGLGVPWDALSSEQELLIQVFCDSTSARVEVGNGSNLQYIWKEAWEWIGTGWKKHILTGSSLVSDAWYVGSANAILTDLDLTITTYIVTYICTWTGSEWKCGCRDSVCDPNSDPPTGGLWQLQAFSAIQPKPSTTTSWYISISSNESDQTLYSWMYSKGYEAGQQDLNLPGTQYSLAVLHFGRPEIQGSVYGASGYGRFVSTAVITEAVKQFAIGYYFGVGSDLQSQVRIVVGTSNNGPNVTYAHGQSWVQMVKDIGSWLNSTVYGSQVNVRGGSDIEVDWSTPETAFSWVNGYAAGFTSPYWLYEFGDAGGCPQDGTASVPGNCNNGWTQDDVEYVSWRVVSYPVPQIYSTAGGNAKQWQQIALYSYLAHDSDMFIIGPLSQSQACAQRGGCQGIDNTPNQAWNQLWTELNSDSRTAQDMSYSTDIKWRQ